MKRVLIVGAGAREHALAFKLRQSAQVGQVVLAPGNAGTAAVATNRDIAPDDVPGIMQLVETEDIDLTVIGPEASLATGVQDHLRAIGRDVVGPDRYGFQLEASKSFAKKLMLECGVPTARSAVFDHFDSAVAYVKTAGRPVVVKADGLAGGKGVTVCETQDDAIEALRAALIDERFAGAGARVIIEDRLDGPEVSLMCLIDGEHALALPLAQDHKRLLDGDRGPNTGGMGAYAPIPGVSDAMIRELVDLTVTPIIRRLDSDGHPYRGVLFAGLILTESGPHVLEYNCRFGDPETEAVIPLIETDLFELLQATASGCLPKRIEISAAVYKAGIVLASAGYPTQPHAGVRVRGLDDASDALIFHAGTSQGFDGQVTSCGGRIVCVVGSGESVIAARDAALDSPVTFAGCQRRQDIGDRAIETGRMVAYSLAATRRVHARNNANGDEARIVVLASGNGSNLQALIDASEEGRLAARVCGVISHRIDAKALERAHDSHIPHAYVPIEGRRNSEARARHEAALLEMVGKYDPELIVLAGWMLILSGRFIEQVGVPIINVHPALLPVEGEPLDIPILKGMHAVRDALEMRLPYTGASVHYVVPEVDAGPVIARAPVTILACDDEDSLHARLKLIEHQLLIDAVASMTTRRPAPVASAPNRRPAQISRTEV